MTFLEKNLEDIIFETDSDLLNDAGLHFPKNRKRQLKIGNYGIADLVTWKTDGPFRHYVITIYELKKDKIDVGAYLQALNYKKGVDRYLKQRKVSFTYTIQIVLIGSKIDNNSSFIYMPDYDSDLYLFTYEYKFDGMKFKIHDGYSLTNEYFNIESKNKNPF